jgi:hypothetical protein
VATITGRTGRSTLLPCDTPGVMQSTADGLPRDTAEAAWRAVTPSIAGTPHARVSRDGGRTYPARHTRPLPPSPPDQPCTVPVYDPGSGTGRMLALDLDPGRGRGPSDAAFEVSAQADAIASLMARLGGRGVTDVSPHGGRHVYVLFAAALPWRELRDLARALSLRFPAIDPAPMASLGGQISPPGARHKSGGWRVLSTSLEDARAAAEYLNGPEVWDALLTELAAELRHVEPLQPAGHVPADAELDTGGAPWIPRLGGRAPLSAEHDQMARTGRWNQSRYPGCSPGKPRTRHQ